MIPDGERSSGRRAEDATAVFMTSTYLILLAFFVVLTSVARFEPAKSEEVLQSVTAAFGTGPARLPGPSGAGRMSDGLAEAAERYREIGRLAETMIAMVRIEEVEPGREMQLTLPTASLFVGENLRPEATDLLDGMAKVLASPSRHHEFEVEFIDGPTDAPAAVLRAGVMARALASSGVPQRSVSIGLEAANPERVRFVFRTVDRGRERFTFARDAS